MKFEKEREHKLVANTMTFPDRHGTEIDRCISFDDSTGIAVVYEPEDGPGGSGPMIKRGEVPP